MSGRRKFNKEFKLKVVNEIEAGKTAAQVAREYRVGNNLIYRWHKEYRFNPDNAFSGNGNASSYEAKIAELERMIGRLTMENELLKKVLARMKGTGS